MSANEWTEATIIAAISFIVGFTYVKRTPSQNRRIGLDHAKATHRSDSIISRVFIGAPLRAAMLFACILFVAGLWSGGVRGFGIIGALKAGVAAALVYGFGAAVLAVPVAIFGGLVALFVRKKR